MHYPLEISLGAARINAHLIFEMLAYTAGYQAYVRLRRRSADRISDEHRNWILLGAAAGAFLGSHVLGVLERPEELYPFGFAYFMANKTVLGGFLGGLTGVEVTKKLLGVRASSGDLMTFPILLALAIGRVGCHFAGLADGTQGLPSALPWAVDFGDGIPRHPVNLYEILLLAGIALLLRRLEKNGPLADGLRFKIFLILYLAWRFAAEWLKPAWFFPFGLSSIQLAALAGLAYYRKTVVMLFKSVFPTIFKP
ncbi:MAG TPA: prolipoprotein diacylglyceryl transferase [Saprospiraceae bacterium]|nr:prolipoprotein diacylglyceryl transferase [Saprospiraceae bacterium]HNM24496.1 prolipoprotein diacylglyceryl transferase [Saprospiraceae bacterium]